MNSNFVKIEKDRYYSFKDNEKHKEIKFLKRELKDCDVYCYDILRLTKDLNYGFIDFILKELIKSKDLLMCEILFCNDEILKILHKNNLKVGNINYEIPFKNKKIKFNYEVEYDLNSENKKYFLDHINEIGIINQEYIDPKNEYQVISDKWFGIEDYEFLTYKYNNKIVGMVDYKIFDNYETSNDLYNYSNSICIRAIFANNKEILEDILKDLGHRYQKRIIINHLYSDKMLKDAIENVGGILKYIYVINKNNI